MWTYREDPEVNTQSNNNDGINSLIELLSHKGELLWFCRYAERVHFLRCYDNGGITDRFQLISDKNLA
jgi:hypothetical protein